MSGNTTSLDDLPTTTENIVLEQTEKPQQQPTNEQMDNKNINEFVNGIQSASANGLLELPSRDIPQSQEPITHDESIQANYIAPSIGNDYIQEHQTNQEIIQNNSTIKKSCEVGDELLNEFQNPFIIGILYFLFQLPIVKKSAFKYLPKLFNNDGNFNFIGHLISSILFSGSFFGINKAIQYFGE